MQCPTDGTTLVMSERSGIEIDYCPECRGVWLDRGELDKIIDRAATQGTGYGAEPVREPVREQVREPGGGAWANPPAQPQSAPAPRYAASGYGSRGQGGYGHPRKRRESWLSELFD